MRMHVMHAKIWRSTPAEHRWSRGWGRSGGKGGGGGQKRDGMLHLKINPDQVSGSTDNNEEVMCLLCSQEEAEYIPAMTA